MTATNGKPLFRLQAVQETSPKTVANRNQIHAETKHTNEQPMNDAATMSKSKGKERTIYTYKVTRNNWRNDTQVQTIKTMTQGKM